MSEHIPPWMFRSKLPNKTVQEEEYMGKIPNLLQWKVSNLNQRKWYPKTQFVNVCIKDLNWLQMFMCIIYLDASFLRNYCLCCSFAININFIMFIYLQHYISLSTDMYKVCEVLELWGHLTWLIKWFKNEKILYCYP